jgi:hypothetical protein
VGTGVSPQFLAATYGLLLSYIGNVRHSDMLGDHENSSRPFADSESHAKLFGLPRFIVAECCKVTGAESKHELLGTGHELGANLRPKRSQKNGLIPCTK